MPRNGSGTYTLPAGNPVVTGTTISSTVQNNTTSDIATALTASIAKDGQTTPTANLPMGTFRHTGVGDGVARTDYTSLGQTQDGVINWVDSGGTADAITATYTPVVTTLVDGQLFYVRAGFANATTTPTFSPNSLTARTIVKNGGVALVAGDIVGNGHELILRYDLAGTRYELLNPGIPTNATNATNATNLVGSGTISSTTTGTTQSPNDNSTKIATTAYVDAATGISIAQIVYSATGAVATGTTAMVYDDTIPQNTEGDQYLSASITPQSATSTLEIEAKLILSSSATVGIAMIMALFKDTTADALTATFEMIEVAGGGFPRELFLKYRVSAGSTSAQTFKIRAGSGGAGTTTVNGAGGARYMGNVANSYIKITEYLP